MNLLPHPPQTAHPPSLPLHLVMLLRAEYGQMLAKGVRLLGKLTGSYGEPETTRGALVLRWTSKLGRCLTRQSKRICSEATTEKAISNKPSKGYIRGVPQRNNEVEMNE